MADGFLKESGSSHVVPDPKNNNKSTVVPLFLAMEHVHDPMIINNYFSGAESGVNLTPYESAVVPRDNFKNFS